jgi:hypothetical protein
MYDIKWKKEYYYFLGGAVAIVCAHEIHSAPFAILLWPLGLAVSFWPGEEVSKFATKKLRYDKKRRMELTAERLLGEVGLPEEASGSLDAGKWGRIERPVFTLLVAFAGLAPSIPAMIAWIGAKTCPLGSDHGNWLRC